MHNKRKKTENDPEYPLESFCALNRMNSEVEWTNLFKRAQEPVRNDFPETVYTEELPLVGHTKQVGSEFLKSNKTGRHNNKKNGFKEVNYDIFSEHRHNLPSFSRFNSIINEELHLENHLSAIKEPPIDAHMIKFTEVVNKSVHTGYSIDKGRQSADDLAIPSFGRFKSNESFGMMLARNCSAYHITEHNINHESDHQDLQYPHFGNLITLLKKHFKEKHIDEKNLAIRSYELDVLKAIITRKYKNKINVDVKSFFLKDKLDEINQLVSSKRPEENSKFIFKRGMKSLRERLKLFEGKDLKKKEFETFFYNYYFSESCKKHKINVDEIQNPCNSKGVKTKLKTVNNEYVSNVAKSDKFIKDFNDYISANLRIDYEATIDSKIEALIKRWEEMYSRAEEKSIALQDIINYVLKNQKCKLPWTGREIEAAIHCVTELFKSCRTSTF